MPPPCCRPPPPKPPEPAPQTSSRRPRGRSSPQGQIPLPVNFSYAKHTKFCGGIRMADTRADQCRKNAEECRQQASKALKDAEKTAWLKMATDWLRLAESLEASAKGTRKPNSN